MDPTLVISISWPAFRKFVLSKNRVTNPNIIIGDYTYYDDPEDSENFERNVLYHFPFIGDKLVIGKFCAIARDVKFIMNSPRSRPATHFGNSALTRGQ